MRPVLMRPASCAGTTQALQLERVDLSMTASDARGRLLAVWVEQPRQQLLTAAFADFAEQQVASLQQLAEVAAGDAAELGAPSGSPALLLDSWQRTVLGFASTAVAVRDASQEQLFAAPGGGTVLEWLPDAVQASDAIGSAAAELQLLLPHLLALLHSPSAAAAVDAAVVAVQEQLELAEGAGAAPEPAAEAAMESLLAVSAQHAVVGALMQVLQRAQAALLQLLPAEELPSQAAQQLQLAAAVADAWDGLAAAFSPATASDPPGSCWQQCSGALAAVVAAQVQEHALPALAAALQATAGQLRAQAPALAQRGTPAAASLRRGEAGGLVPFSDFDDGLLGGELLGELEPPGSPVAASAAAGTALQQPVDLVPFTEFDESLAGAGENERRMPLLKMRA